MTDSETLFRRWQDAELRLRECKNAFDADTRGGGANSERLRVLCDESAVAARDALLIFVDKINSRGGDPSNSR